MTFASYFARDIDEEIPLIDDVYVPAESGDAPEQEIAPPRLRICRVLELLWYIAFASIIGASIYVLLRYPLEPREYIDDPRAIVLGSALGLALWGITFLVRRCARRERS